MISWPDDGSPDQKDVWPRSPATDQPGTSIWKQGKHGTHEVRSHNLPILYPAMPNKVADILDPSVPHLCLYLYLYLHFKGAFTAHCPATVARLLSNMPTNHTHKLLRVPLVFLSINRESFLLLGMDLVWPLLCLASGCLLDDSIGQRVQTGHLSQFLDPLREAEQIESLGLAKEQDMDPETPREGVRGCTKLVMSHGAVLLCHIVCSIILSYWVFYCCSTVCCVTCSDYFAVDETQMF